MKKAIPILLFLACIALFTTCSKGGGGGGGGTTLDCSTVANKAFAADVNPTVQSFCNTGGCHAAGSTNGPGPLTNYAEVSAAKNQIRAALASGTMPKGITLSTSVRNSFLCWIDSGAPNN